MKQLKDSLPTSLTAPQGWPRTQEIHNHTL